MKQYNEALKQILDYGIVKENRTGIDTKSLFGMQMRFDLRDGFPAVTTKKLAWKAVVSELLWFLEGSGDERRLAEILHGTRDAEKKTIWTANAEADYWKPNAKYEGDLGKVYGNMWRKWPGNPDQIVKITRRPKEDDTPIDYNPTLLVPEDAISGTTRTLPRENKFGHTFRILSNEGVINGNTHYKIQFENTGYITTVSRPNIRSKTHRDWWEKMQSGVGVYGREKKHNPTELDKRIYSLWDNMISRCYDPEHPQYKFYGGRGVTVSTEWQNFSKFEHSIKQVPGFYDWCMHNKFELDKDYYGADQYSASTTIFLHKKYNQEIAKGTFAETDSYVHRRQLFVDQIANLIDGIKNDPNGRRHLVIAYNVGELQDMALPPCHYTFQFDVTGSRLNCLMNMRSADYPLGVPFNIASYALLTHIIAHLCNLDVGELIVVTGDSHIYVNQIDGVEEQLKRTPKQLPTLKINNIEYCKTLDDVLKLTVNDFVLEGYNPEESIKFPFAT